MLDVFKKPRYIQRGPSHRRGNMLKTKFHVLLHEDDLLEEKRLMRLMSAALPTTHQLQLHWNRGLNHTVMKLIAPNSPWDYAFVATRDAEAAAKIQVILEILEIDVPVLLIENDASLEDAVTQRCPSLAA